MRLRLTLSDFRDIMFPIDSYVENAGLVFYLIIVDPHA
jgi:hypothetical protein